MSGSAKRGRTFDEIARILVDAETFGVKLAAVRHGIHRNTVRNLRDDWSEDVRVVRCCARIREQASKGWIARARHARHVLLEDVLRLASRGKNLRSTVEALRRVGELVLASEIVNPDRAETGGAERSGTDQPPPAGTPEGAGGKGGAGTRH